MERPVPEFHFPMDVKLRSNPLAEAWLEIRWKLTPSEAHPNLQRDPHFKFALGPFSESVKNEYGFIENLSASNIPEDVVPYVVRHRFRPKPNTWPLLQIGPGIAAVNFLRYGRWEDFEQAALYLQRKLVAAYQSEDLTTESVALYYRDIEPFSYSEGSVLEFLQTYLNTSVILPEHIPGGAGRQKYPSHSDLAFTYDLDFPKGQGTIRLSTGTRHGESLEPTNVIAQEVVIWQHEITSRGEDAPAISDEIQFRSWLNDAHTVIHEWFFSLIDGPLRAKYESE